MYADTVREWVFGSAWMTGGGILLARSLGWLDFRLKDFLPLLLVVVGVRLIWRDQDQDAASSPRPGPAAGDGYDTEPAPFEPGPEAGRFASGGAAAARPAAANSATAAAVLRGALPPTEGRRRAFPPPRTRASARPPGATARPTGPGRGSAVHERTPWQHWESWQSWRGTALAAAPRTHQNVGADERRGASASLRGVRQRRDDGDHGRLRARFAPG